MRKLDFSKIKNRKIVSTEEALADVEPFLTDEELNNIEDFWIIVSSDKDNSDGSGSKFFVKAEFGKKRDFKDK